MNRFVGIDFETANAKRTSACALGVVVMEDNKIIERKSWLIKPEPFVFNPYNIQVHHITPDMVINAPTFDVIWDELSQYLNNEILVAHNAPFDISVLRSTMGAYDIPPIDISFLCTYRLATIVFPELINHRLNTLSHYLNIPLNHHNAASDAEASLLLLSRIFSEANATNIKELEKTLQFNCGQWNHYDNYSPCRSKTPQKPKASKKEKRVYDEFCYDDDFLGKNYVFTGELLSMTREKASEVVIRGGGNVKSSISNNTDVLVCGIPDLSKFKGETESSKMRKAKELKNKGAKIQIIYEDDFIRLIDNDLYSLCFDKENA